MLRILPFLLGVLLAFTGQNVYGELNHTSTEEPVALCNWDECRQLEEPSEQDPMEKVDQLADNLGHDYQLCQALDSYSRCLKAAARKCRGNLHYSSYVKGLSRVLVRKNCSALLAADTSLVRSTERSPPAADTTSAPFPIHNDSADASISVVRMRLSDAGNLSITIRTQTKFRGTFVLSHPRLPGVQSALLSPSSLTERFTLALEWQQETYDYPVQTWQATGDLALRNYSGDYILEMIPCMSTSPEFSKDHRNCEPHNAKPYILPIQFLSYAPFPFENTTQL